MIYPNSWHLKHKSMIRQYMIQINWTIQYTTSLWSYHYIIHILHTLFQFIHTSSHHTIHYHIQHLNISSTQYDHTWIPISITFQTSSLILYHLITSFTPISSHPRDQIQYLIIISSQVIIWHKYKYTIKNSIQTGMSKLQLNTPHANGITYTLYNWNRIWN